MQGESHNQQKFSREGYVSFLTTIASSTMEDPPTNNTTMYTSVSPNVEDFCEWLDLDHASAEFWRDDKTAEHRGSLAKKAEHHGSLDEKAEHYGSLAEGAGHYGSLRSTYDELEDARETQHELENIDIAEINANEAQHELENVVIAETNASEVQDKYENIVIAETVANEVQHELENTSKVQLKPEDRVDGAREDEGGLLFMAVAVITSGHCQLFVQVNLCLKIAYVLSSRVPEHWLTLKCVYTFSGQFCDDDPRGGTARVQDQDRTGGRVEALPSTWPLHLAT